MEVDGSNWHVFWEVFCAVALRPDATRSGACLAWAERHGSNQGDTSVRMADRSVCGARFDRADVARANATFRSRRPWPIACHEALDNAGLTDATARVRKYQFGTSMCQISRNGWDGQCSQLPPAPLRQGHSRELGITRSCTQSYVDSKHADRRLRRLHEGSEDCRFAARAIFATFVQSSRAASMHCHHSLRPPQPRGQKQSAPPALRELIPNHTTLAKRQLVHAECSTAGVRPRQGLVHTRFNAGPIRIRAEIPSVTRKWAFLNHAGFPSLMISSSPPTIVPFFTYSSTSPATRRTAAAETPWLSGVATGKAAFSAAAAAADTLIGPNHTVAIQIAVRWHERVQLILIDSH